MPTCHVEIDIDRPDAELRYLNLPVAPTHYLKSPNGLHLKYNLEGLPDWFDLKSEDKATKDRSREILSLFRWAMAGQVKGFDPAAPLQNLRKHGKEYLRNGEQTEDTLDLLGCVGKVAGAQGPSDEITDDDIRSIGLEPGGEYTREKCPFGDDHTSGGDGKGTCVKCLDGGVICMGQHASTGGKRFATWAKLLGKTGRAQDNLILWGSRREDFAAISSVLTDLAPQAASARIRYLFQELPRPTPKPKRFPIFWSVDHGKAVQYFNQSHVLDDSLDTNTRIMDVCDEYPAFLKIAKDKEGNITGWEPNTAAIKGFLANDASRWIEFGVTPARVAPVPPLFTEEIGWSWENGMPCRILLPERKTEVRDRVSVEQAKDHLKLFLSEIPVPDGMKEQHANALRLAYLLPALTETYPGQQPLVMLAGGTGAGKGRTTSAIQKLWKWHFANEISKGEAREFEHKLFAGAKGSIFTIDELNVQASSAVDTSTLNRLKSVMTTERLPVRMMYSQHMPLLRMTHCWYATGRSFAGLSAELENDWARRTIPIQFPETLVSQEYTQALDDFVHDNDPLDVIDWLGVILKGRDHRACRAKWSKEWPATMPAWQAAAGIGRELGIVLDPAEFADLLPRDESAIDLFREWWDQLRAKEIEAYQDGKQYGLTPVCQYASTKTAWVRFSRPIMLGSALISQAKPNPRGIPSFGVAGGVVSVYNQKGKHRFRFSPNDREDGETWTGEKEKTQSSENPDPSAPTTADHTPSVSALFAGAPSRSQQSAGARSSLVTGSATSMSATLAPKTSHESSRGTDPCTNSETDGAGSQESSPIAAMFATASSPVSNLSWSVPTGSRDPGASPSSKTPSALNANERSDFKWPSNAPASARADSHGTPDSSTAPTASSPQVTPRLFGSLKPATSLGDTGSLKKESPAPVGAVAASTAMKSPGPSYSRTNQTSEGIGPVVSLDFESWHPNDKLLKQRGAFDYWASGEAEATALVATKVNPDTQRFEWVVIWSPEPLAKEIDFPEHVKALIQDATITYHTGPECPEPLTQAVGDGCLFAAHNAEFDARAWMAMGWPDPAGWIDTMHFSKGLLKGGALETTLQTLFGYGKTDAPGTFLAWNQMSAPVRWRLVRYCAADAIPTAAALMAMLPFLTQEQIDGSRCHFIMNQRGMLVDQNLAYGIMGLRDEMLGELVKEIKEFDTKLTRKFIRSAKIVPWLEEHGLKIHKQTTKGQTAMDGDLLEEIWRGEDSDDFEWTSAEFSDIVRKVVYAKLCDAGISAAKAATAIKFADKDGVIHDYLVFAGTHTWRGAGRRLQPQNFARGGLPDSHKKLRDRVDELMDLVRQIGELGPVEEEDGDGED